MQTIVGSGGAIGVELAKALPEYTNKIRLVSRNPVKVNPTDEVFTADVLNPNELNEAIKGSEIVYVTVGFPYSYQVWKQNWPVFISNLINACKTHKCKLVFFDNIYMYDKDHLNGMTEETPVNPPSKKGTVRAEIANMIMREVQAENLTALIARSADFYGPGIQNTSMLTELILKPFSKGQKANWMGKTNCKHSFTYTPDAGKATALLGNTESAYNQVWHLPTAGNPPTGKEWIEHCAKAFGVPAKFRTAPAFALKLMGLFNTIMREMPEMLYQYDRNYVFNSDKFEKTFNFKPTPYLEGIKAITEKDYPR